MSIFYFKNRGVCLWDNILQIKDDRLDTFTLLAQNEATPNNNWANLVNNLKAPKTSIFEWRTIGTKLAHSKTLELKTLKHLTSQFGKNIEIKKGASNSLTYLREFQSVINDDVDKLRDNRHSIFIIAESRNHMKSEILGSLEKYYTGLLPDALQELLSNEPSALIVAAYPNETHEAIQVLANKDNELGCTYIKNALKALHANSIAEEDAWKITKYQARL